MAAPKLNEEQRLQIVEWLTAGYSSALIQLLFQARGWPAVTYQSINHYRDQHRDVIEARFKERLAAAYDAGLAQVEARVKALVDHAQKLEEIKWLPDDKGKLHNEKAWRETLDDIAKEMGHRRQGIDLTQRLGTMTDAQLDEYIAATRQTLAEDSGSDPSHPAE